MDASEDAVLKLLARPEAPSGEAADADGAGVLDAVLAVLPRPPDDPLVGVKSVADLQRFDRAQLKLVLGMHAQHRKRARESASTPAVSTGASLSSLPPPPPTKKRRIRRIHDEEVPPPAAAMGDDDEDVDMKAGGEAESGGIRFLGDPLEDDEDEDLGHGDDDEELPLDGKDASSSSASTPAAPSGRRYQHVAVGTMLVSVGDIVEVKIDTEGAEGAPRSMARVDWIQEPADMGVTWCYNRRDLDAAARGTADDFVLTSDDDYCLSTHTQTLPLSCIVAVERDVALVVLYDVETRKLSWIDDAHEHGLPRRDPRFDQFVDCLAAVPERRAETTYWRHAEDVFLRPSTDIGDASNPQRAVLREADYRITFAALDEVVRARCYCCGKTRMCRHRVVSGPPAARRESKRGSSSSSAAEVDADDNAPRYVGTFCHARVVAVQRFLEHMATITARYQASDAPRMSHEQLRAAYTVAQQFLAATPSTIAFRGGSNA